MGVYFFLILNTSTISRDITGLYIVPIETPVSTSSVPDNPVRITRIHPIFEQDQGPRKNWMKLYFQL